MYAFRHVLCISTKDENDSYSRKITMAADRYAFDQVLCMSTKDG